MIIWLASYPRSGNTFLRTLINHTLGLKTSSIYGDLNDIAADPALATLVGHEALPKDFCLSTARASPTLYLIKTHEAYSAKHHGDKFIYILRDGREATVSYHHYYQQFAHKNLSITEIIHGAGTRCTWTHHVESWQRAKHPRGLLLSFEEVTTDPLKAARLIAEYAGQPMIATDIPNFQQLHKVSPTFFRSGQRDSYKTELTAAEQKLFLKVNGHAMKKHGYINRLPSPLRPKTFLHTLASLFSLPLPKA